MINSKVSIVKCQSYTPHLVLEAMRKTLDLLGGLTNFVKPESRVLVKPNLLMAKEPEFGITTHPEVLRAVIKILKEINCTIIVGDGPSVWGNQIENVTEVYARTGTGRVCEEEGVKLVEFNRRRWREKFPITSWLDECDHLVSLPKFKTHDFTILTGAIKNLFGLIPGTYKTELHKNYFDKKDFARILVDIYYEARPSLTIVDGIVAMEADGPATSGKLRNTGIIVASADCVALDSILAIIMGLEPYDILTTKEAAARGFGIADINFITILGERLKDVVGESFLLPVTSIKKSITKSMPLPVVNVAKKLVRYYPYVVQSNCIKCSACIDACPNQAISKKDERIVFNYSRCIACFCCQEACPASAIKIKKSLLAKLIGL